MLSYLFEQWSLHDHVIKTGGRKYTKHKTERMHV